MRIKASEFNLADSKNPDFSMMEVDCFNTPDWQLRIRKNLKTGKFEAFKHFHRTNKDEVIWSYRDLNQLLKHTNNLSKEKTGFDPEDSAE